MSSMKVFKLIMKLRSFLYMCIVFSHAQAWSTTSRLQRHSIPSSYSLKIVPDIISETFIGEVTILMKIKQSLTNITLNSKFLNVTEITLDQEFGQTGHKLDAENELLHVYYEDLRYIDPGEHLLNIKFKGSLRGSVGFYCVELNSGTCSSILATKFSPTHAREAFPCFDEPNFKSIFNIRLVKPDDSWIALSNMEEIGQMKTAEGILVDFRSTIRMSTYLLAWFLMDFNFNEIVFQSQEKSIPLRLFTMEGKESDRKEALTITKRALEFFENYTNIPYPLSKLDSIEIPHYRSRGMEHWGLVVYKTHSVTYNPLYHSSKLSHWFDATQLIAHEISHMWFGNLVTHEWYNDLWLTEGFARFMQYKASFAITGAPFMRMLFQNHKFSFLFEGHCNHDSAIETAGYSRSLYDIGKKFGFTTYDQGGAILLMLEDVIGHAKFQKAVQVHLWRHKYAYATTGDFIDTVQGVVPTINIRDFMLSYLFQKNLPLISVTEDEDHYILKQEPFCKNVNFSIFGTKWTIPIKYITSGKKVFENVWFARDMSNVTITKARNQSFIIVNHQNKGLYRTLYTRRMYDEITSGFKELHNEDRGFLIEEAFLMEFYERLFCDIPLQLFGKLRYLEEIDFLTFEYARRSFFLFTKIHNFEENVIDILKSYFIYTFGALYHNVSWVVTEHESLEHRLLRLSVLESFCSNDLLYVGCYKDVKHIVSNNLTIHEDIHDIFEGVLENMKKNNISLEKEVPLQETISKPIPVHWEKLLVEYDHNCSTWIKENLTMMVGGRSTR